MTKDSPTAFAQARWSGQCTIPFQWWRFAERCCCCCCFPSFMLFPAPTAFAQALGPLGFANSVKIMEQGRRWGLVLNLRFGVWLPLVLCFSLFPFRIDSSCSSGCRLALASYNVWPGSDVNFISRMLGNANKSAIVSYSGLPNENYVQVAARVNVPFTCDCINGEFLAHVFSYDVNYGDTYDLIATRNYANLTTTPWLQRFNSYPATHIPDTPRLNVTVNCSCGARAVSERYGLFLTYPLRSNETLSSLSQQFNLSQNLLQSYNPGFNFSSRSGLVYIPAKDENGNYPPLLNPSTLGISGGAIAGICVAAIAGVVLLAAGFYIGIYRKRKLKEASLLSTLSDEHSNQAGHAEEAAGLVSGAVSGFVGITVDKLVEFSYEELKTAADDFSLANKIGEGGFGAVYYAELRGEKAAIKKMDMLASKEFLAELKVLTNIHHLNLVRLIGYCVDVSLFLVYEYIDNGNLSQHLRGSGREPLPWPTRVQIALESARGLEYLHEHTVPIYIHCDIKSENILIDKNFHAKVADFGLAKLTEVRNTSDLAGTFGYMPPEYARYDVSPKSDVFALGVVFFELLSAKKAIIEPTGSESGPMGLVGLFEGTLSQPDPQEKLHELVDPRLGDNYSLESVWKVAQLAQACTNENPQLRPSMRSIVVALMTLSSATEDWDVRSFFENQALTNLMSGR